MRQVALYFRVGTPEQAAVNQERALREVAAGRGWEISRTYSDLVVSGARGQDRHPEFNALCSDAAKGQFDVVMAWSLDHLGQSLHELVRTLSEIRALKVGLYLHQQGLDTTTNDGEALFQVIDMLAEFENAMAQERIRDGVARAKADGKKLGRPRLDARTESKIRNALRKSDMGMRKIAAKFGVAVGTVQRIKSEVA